MVSSRWPEPGLGQGPKRGAMVGCMQLCGSLHALYRDRDQGMVWTCWLWTRYSGPHSVVCFKGFHLSGPSSGVCEMFPHNIGHGPYPGPGQCDSTRRKLCRTCSLWSNLGPSCNEELHPQKMLFLWTLALLPIKWIIWSCEWCWVFNRSVSRRFTFTLQSPFSRVFSIHGSNEEERRGSAFLLWAIRRTCPDELGSVW